MKICIDCGHFGRYNQSPVDKSYYESEIVWTLGGYLEKELEAYGISVKATRTDPEKDMQVYERGRLAKGCDILLSLHTNACGTESTDYPLACCTISGEANGIGKALAETVAETMETIQTGRIVNRRGSSGDWYGILRGANSVGVPGVLLEHSFHTNKNAVRWLKNEDNLKLLAKKEAECIAQYYGIKKPVSVLYRVQTGAFADRKNAEAMLKKLTEAGFEGFIVS